MLRTLKRFSWLGLLAGSVQASLAFSLLGPVNEAYQVNVIGYNLTWDIGAPKNLGEEYRRNTPVIYYTCDANFWDYFGTRGVAEIDKAFAVFNSIPAASKMSADLSEYPYTARRTNYKAESLGMFDIKSWTMWMIVEQLGLAEPERYVWTLHDRWLQPNTQCPQGEVYLVIKRNFDPLIGTSLDQLKPTSYINGTLYSYQIIELCNAPLPPQAWAQPVPVDALGDIYTTIAGGFGFNDLFTFSPYGVFFTGLTRDDVGGLRYLLRPNNINIENAGTNTVTLITNTVPQLLTSSNLTLLAAQALTNAAGPLQALYPNLIVLSTSNYFVNVYITNAIAYFTNYPWDPIGTAAHLAFTTNVTPIVETRYVHDFGNLLLIQPQGDRWVTVPIVRLPRFNNGRQWITVETSSVALTNAPWSPYGVFSVLTNNFSTTYQTNAIMGDFILVPTNFCEIGIVAAQLTNVVAFTNFVLGATNIATTNVIGGTNVGTVLSFSQQVITYSTNKTFVVFPVTCPSNTVALQQGIDKISFVRRDYDSLLSRFFVPLTNEYVLNTVTNGTLTSFKARRFVTTPDILITAQDLAAGPDQRPFTPALRRSINYNTGNVYPGLAGPGTIEQGAVFIFNKVGPIYYNYGMLNTNVFLTEFDQIPLYIWGSFDGTTNSPVIYPNDASITDMEMQVLTQVTPQYLPLGVRNVDYIAQLELQSSSEAWRPPNYWTLSPRSPGLPPGLNIATGGDGSGIISGIPQDVGTFDFIVRIVDSQGHVVDRSYAIRIDPPQ